MLIRLVPAKWMSCRHVALAVSQYVPTPTTRDTNQAVDGVDVLRHFSQHTHGGTPTHFTHPFHARNEPTLLARSWENLSTPHPHVRLKHANPKRPHQISTHSLFFLRRAKRGANSFARVRGSPASVPASGSSGALAPRLLQKNLKATAQARTYSKHSSFELIPAKERKMTNRVQTHDSNTHRMFRRLPDREPRQTKPPTVNELHTNGHLRQLILICAATTVSQGWQPPSNS